MCGRGPRALRAAGAASVGAMKLAICGKPGVPAPGAGAPAEAEGDGKPGRFDAASAKPSRGA